MNTQHILDLIDDYDLAGAFAAIDALGIKSPEYSRLKKEFMSGKHDVDFIGRLKMLVRSLKPPGNSAPSQTGSGGGNIQTRVKDLLAKGNVDEALELLLQHARTNNDHSLENDCIHQMGRYNSAKRQKKDGVITTENWNLTEAQVMSAVKDMLKEVK